MTIASPRSVHCLIILRNYQQFTRDRVPIIFINVYIERVDSVRPPVRSSVHITKLNRSGLLKSNTSPQLGKLKSSYADYL